MQWLRSLAVSLFAGLCLAGLARAETKVELKGVHLCCRGCVAAAARICKGIEGVKVVCDAKNKTITLTAPDDQTAQKALDALAAGGFHGQTGNKDLAIKDDSGAAQGKVGSATVTGIHNCCGACTAAIKKTVKKVDGVTNAAVKPQQLSFTVTGQFDPTELVKALNAAGFHVKVSQ